MNHWTKLSTEFANQRNYLDELFKVYPTIPEGIRDIDKPKWKAIEKAYNEKNKLELLDLLLSLDLFPIKDSYVAYLKRDPAASGRNPATVGRLYGRLCELGLDKIWERCSEPKETNRQIGPLFRRWINKGVLGVPVLKLKEFLATKENAVLDASDREMMNFAKKHLNYNRDKGLDFVGRFNAQFSDAISTLQAPGVKAIIVAILDGVLYIKGNNKMYKDITTTYSEYNIMSALLFREFLFQV